MFPVCRCLLLWLALALAARGASWPPAGWVVLPNSTSPNGQYGILIPRVGGYTEEVTAANYLADLKAERRLEKIAGSSYFENASRRGLAAVWPADSSWCAVIYDGRFGFNDITVLELTPGGIRQTQLGATIHQALDRHVVKHSQGQEISLGDGFAYARATGSRTLRVRAIAETNPRRDSTAENVLALFQGTYDLKTKKWLVARTREITPALCDGLTTAMVPLDERRFTAPTLKERVAWLDAQMTLIYQTAKWYLPEAEADAARRGQIAWLKKYKAATTFKAKAALLRARIPVLQGLFW